MTLADALQAIAIGVVAGVLSGLFGVGGGIVSSDVPSARFNGIRHQPASSGTITSPPPMPSSPETTPATIPMIA